MKDGTDVNISYDFYIDYLGNVDKRFAAIIRLLSYAKDVEISELRKAESLFFRLAYKCQELQKKAKKRMKKTKNNEAFLKSMNTSTTDEM